MLLIRGSAGHWYEAQLAGWIRLLIRGSVDHWYEAQWEGYAADMRLSRPLIRGSVGGVDSATDTRLSGKVMLLIRGSAGHWYEAQLAVWIQLLIRGSVDHWYEAQWEDNAADTRLSRPLIRGSVGGADLTTDTRLSRPLIRGSVGRVCCWYEAQQATDTRLSWRCGFNYWYEAQ